MIGWLHVVAIVQRLRVRGHSWGGSGTGIRGQRSGSVLSGLLVWQLGVVAIARAKLELGQGQ